MTALSTSEEEAPWVAGVDGCRAGWVVVGIALHSAAKCAPHLHVCASLADILALTPHPVSIAIDMPIGLLDVPQPGGRLCDRQARRLLGRRASSVFTPPCRPDIVATTYEQVRHHGLSRQAFGIVPKIRELDTWMTPTLQQQVYEAHPELAFCALGGQPMQYSKKTPAGRAERVHALSQAGDPALHALAHTFPRMLAAYRRTQVAPDDLLDAAVLAWVARRLAHGQAQRLPACPPLDARGLRMEICF